MWMKVVFFLRKVFSQKVLLSLVERTKKKKNPKVC
jgi:hypothetical protein